MLIMETKSLIEGLIEEHTYQRLMSVLYVEEIPEEDCIRVCCVIAEPEQRKAFLHLPSTVFAKSFPFGLSQGHVFTAEFYTVDRTFCMIDGLVGIVPQIL